MSVPTLDQEVTFISGLNPDGTLALYSYAAWNPDTIPADYSGGYTLAMKWGTPTAGTAGGTVTYYFNPTSNWTSTEQQWLASGLALWSAICNITFVQTTVASDADITFTRGTDKGASTSPTADTSDPNAGKTDGSDMLKMTAATVSISTGTNGFGPIDGSFATKGAYPIMTFIHEEGHAIGLGHAGAYNSTVNTATQQYSPYDTRLWSLMSYIDADDDSALYYTQYPVTGTNWGNAGAYAREPTTWMPLDILAAQRLYGLPTSTPLSGGQTFGFNCNIAGAIEPYFDFTKNSAPVVTLWDMGQNNTLDLSGFAQRETVNLNPGTFSSVGGLVNNIAIAFNTAIDTLVCGVGGSTVTCNSDGDAIYLGIGTNVVTGGTGDDAFHVTALGSETLNGGGGLNKVYYSGSSSGYTLAKNADGSISVTGGANDKLTHVQQIVFTDTTLVVGTAPTSDFNGDTSGDLLWQSSSGQAGVWLLSGSTILSGALVGPDPGPDWKVIGSADFDGNGEADILWQATTGQAGIWLMNGSTMISAALVGPDPGSSWKVKGAGDFNGDGKADILWQAVTGQAGIWFMSGTTLVSAPLVGPDPGPDWKVIGAGDFNGDGKADILWQNTSGQAGVWLMNGSNLVGSALTGPNPGTSWKIRGIGDFNGDGKADILWQSVGGQAGIWFMNGTTVTSSALVGPNPGTDWVVQGAEDVNGDGYADILWQSTSGQSGAWLMSGSTILSSPLIGASTGPDWHMIVPGTH